MVRNAVGVVVGLIAGMAVNMILIQLNSGVFFPMPADMDMNDADQFNAYLASLPNAAFLLVVLAHLGQAFVGALVAAKIGTSHKMVLAMIIGVLSLAGGVAAMTMYEGPGWLVIELPLYLVAAWAGGRIALRSAQPDREAPSGPEPASHG